MQLVRAIASIIPVARTDFARRVMIEQSHASIDSTDERKDQLALRLARLVRDRALGESLEGIAEAVLLLDKAIRLTSK